MSQMLKLPEVLTLEEAARYLRVSKDTVQELVSQGRMPGQRVKGKWRFLKAALQEWLRGRGPIDNKTAELLGFGAFKDDETLDEIVAAAMKARGRPNEGGRR
ncbi:MAG TPA: helix-turn-helix domain-containing protein [Gemmataceae bacterium]|nr:helix-turn-helix domain-containing protein [Gemmataceae bacterium]